MEQSIIYLWAISEQIKVGLIILCGVLIVCGVCLIGEGSDKKNKYCEEDEGTKLMSTGKKLLITGLSIIIIPALIPSKQDLGFVLAYPFMKSGFNNITQSKQVKQLSELSTLYLDKAIKDLKNGGQD